jgi:hypothetical protein
LGSTKEAAIERSPFLNDYCIIFDVRKDVSREDTDPVTAEAGSVPKALQRFYVKLIKRLVRL